MPRGGRREGAGRPTSNPTRVMRIPLDMVRAAEALQALSRGDFTQRDIAEIMISINANGRAEKNGGLIGADEIRRARLVARSFNIFDPATAADVDDFNRRAMDIGCGRI